MHLSSSRAPAFLASVAVSLSTLPLAGSSLAERLLFPGPNLALKGAAGEFTVHGPAATRGGDAPGAPGKAIDGLPGTAWTAPVAGPCSWNLDLGKIRQVGTVAILWQGEPPPRILLEGSEDGLVWHGLSGPAQTEAAGIHAPETAAFVLAFSSRPIRHLRLSIPETPPAFVVSIREFAVYGSLDEVPSGWLARGSVSGQPDAGLRRAGAVEPLGRVRIGDGWRLVGLGKLPAGKRVVQLVPIASGDAFGLLESTERGGESEGREIVRFSPNEDGSVELRSYFSGLPHGAWIAWDGEWVYVLAEGRLEAYRAALGDGPANERHRIGTVLQPTAAGFPIGFEISSLRLGSDGSFLARVGEVGGVVLDAAGREIEISRGGGIRFRRNGRELAPVPPPSRGASVSSEAGQIFDESVNSDSTLIARIDGLQLSETDGPRVWAAFAEAGGDRIALLGKGDVPETPPLDWNQVGAVGLFAYLAHDRPSVRREAGFEILRRKRNPDKEIEAILARGPSPEEAEGLLSFASGLSRERARSIFKRMAESDDPEVTRFAFRGLGNLPGGVDPQDFLALGVSTDPPVSAEILKQLAQAERSLPGADKVAFALIDHPHRILAKAASSYLIEKEQYRIAFDALDHSDLEADWEAAFTLLVEAPPERVLPGIVDRVFVSASPRFRRLGLEVLCRIYRRIREENANGDLLVEIEDRIGRAVLDPRVDRAALLEAMEQNGLPLPAAESLVAFARNDLALEAFVVSRLRESDAVISGGSKSWLRTLARDQDRDERLRDEVRTLLGVGPLPVESGPPPAPRTAADFPSDEVRSALASLVGDTEAGRALFRRLSCHSCHSREEVIEADEREIVDVLLGRPGPAPGDFEVTLTETDSGALALRVRESGAREGPSWRDAAGNGLASIQAGDESRQWPGTRLPMCDVAPWATLQELADLLSYFSTARSGNPAPIRD